MCAAQPARQPSKVNAPGVSSTTDAPVERGSSPADDHGLKPPEKAGLSVSLFFMLLPPVVAIVLGGLLLTGPERVPWVTVVSAVVAMVCFVLVAPLGRRSHDFENAFFRRSTELAVLGGFTASGVVIYTLVVYQLMGVRTPWALRLIQGLFGG